MPMTLLVLNDTNDTEKRVAAVPESVKKYSDLGYEVFVESGAGDAAGFPDTAYKEAGAKIIKDRGPALAKADIILCVNAPDFKEAELKKGAVLIGALNPYANEAAIKTYAKKNVQAIAMELMPRITRAQSMDILSSQANLAGYKAVLEAVAHFGKAMPMMMTAAGTLQPARVFVMGAGVAGLQAIATARRLGAIVSATDVRLAAKEQVESLGAKYVFVEDEESKAAETAGGYAKEMSAAFKKKQEKLISETFPKQDIVITTANIPGKPAPKLVSEAHVKSMKPGSVIVDLAAANGGNCALTKPGEVTEAHGVTIIGHTNIPARLASDASALYARNLYNFIALYTDKDTKAFTLPDEDDEIIEAVRLTFDGKHVHPNFGGTAPAKKKNKKEAA